MTSDVTPGTASVPALTATRETASGTGLALLLKQSEHTLHRRLQPSLDDAGLLLEHWRILSVLLEHPGLRMSTIAEAAVVPSATLTRHMDTLVGLAMIVRRVDPEDRRRVVSALSAHGEALALRLRAEEQQIEAAIVEGLGAERFAALARELRLLPHVLDL